MANYRAIVGKDEYYIGKAPTRYNAKSRALGMYQLKHPKARKLPKVSLKVWKTSRR